jgi:hypothetical protein
VMMVMVAVNIAVYRNRHSRRRSRNSSRQNHHHRHHKHHRWNCMYFRI